MRLLLYVGLRSAHVEHQLGIVRAYPLENAVQRIRVTRERVQLRLRETDELQKRNFSVHRLDRGDGRVADECQPRDAEFSSGCRELPSPGMYAPGSKKLPV